MRGLCDTSKHAHTDLYVISHSTFYILHAITYMFVAYGENGKYFCFLTQIQYFNWKLHIVTFSRCWTSSLSTSEQHLTRWDRVTHICVSKLSHRWYRQWLVACSAPSDYLTQCSLIVKWTFREKLQWNSYFSFKKMCLKTSSTKRWLSCLGFNVSTRRGRVTHICISRVCHHWS